MSNRYTREADGVWHRLGFSGIAYTDGSDIEQRLLDAVSGAGRLDTFSPDLRDQIVDWPSEYHLSRSRHCLLRPLGIKAGDRVLELGCGCGAITRFLGETGAEVVAVEGNPARARVAAARCRDLRNVRVLCDDFFAFEAQELFDWALLIGVLEYAPIFSTMPDPVEHCLTTAGRWLAAKGRLVVAIENKLGLKYFNGCREDHVGKPFFGIEGLYQYDTPVTFGRKELGDVLDGADFSTQRWYYPFPDYKLPTVVLGSSALTCLELNVADLLLHTQSRDHSGELGRLFNEALAMASLAKNGLIADLSNSFLVVAQRNAGLLASTEPLAWSFAVHRRARFATETIFLRRETGIVVVKNAIAPQQGHETKGDAVQRVTLRCEESPYHRGTLLVRRVIEASAYELSCADMAAKFLPWFDDLLRHAVVASHRGPVALDGLRKLEDYQINGRFIDCVPFNIVEATDATHVIDEEWSIGGQIPLGHVVCRGLIYSLRLCLNRTQRYNLAEMLQHLCAARDLTVGTAEINRWLDLEAAFQEEVTGRRPDGQALSSTSGPYHSLLSVLGQARAIEQRLALSTEHVNDLGTFVREQQTRWDALQAAVEGERKIQEAALTEAEARCDALLAELEQLNKGSREMEAALTEAEARCDALLAELEQLNKGRREMVSSTSWRVTAPLRAVTTALRALARSQRSTLSEP